MSCCGNCESEKVLAPTDEKYYLSIDGQLENFDGQLENYGKPLNINDIEKLLQDMDIDEYDQVLLLKPVSCDIQVTKTVKIIVFNK